MLKFSRLISRSCSQRASSSILFRSLPAEDNLSCLPSQNAARKTSTRFLDIYQMGSKREIEKERARIQDEMNRGYFADMSEMKKHGGKMRMILTANGEGDQVSAASQVLVPAMQAVKFPDFEVSYPDGKTSKLPTCCSQSVTDDKNLMVPKACLLCLSFRASSQVMIESWTKPFINAFGDSKRIQLYEISFIDSWLLCRNPIKRMLLRRMRKSNNDAEKDTLQKHIVYSFGDHYYFRKHLKILNLLTGYVFLVDKFGRIRWQGSGLATQEELSYLVSCTSLLLEED